MNASPSKVYKLLLRFILIFVSLSFLIYILLEPGILGPIIVATMICIFIEPIKKFFKRFGLFHKSASIIAVVVFMLIVSAIFYFVWPVLQKDIGVFFQRKTFLVLEEGFLDLTSQFSSFLGVDFKEFHLREKLFESFKSIDYVGLVSHLTVWFLISPVFVFFFLVDANKIRSTTFKMIPNAYFEVFSLIFYKIWFQFGNYIRARIAEVLLVTVISTILFMAFSYPLPLFLGLSVGVMTMIPYVGPFFGVIPGIVIALINPDISLSLTLALYAIINTFDMIVLFPVLMVRVAAIHPLMVIFAVLIGAKFAGAWGVMLAIPVSGAISIMYVELKKYQFRAV